ncbi:MAG TPA: DNA replication and repair protein RecF, partial [Polyangiaceae bacterium]|nr:DNA replication and repair protein RecF [Polyangiaceae bacterium]
EPGPRLNVISGDNGQGKTSLLEALYFVATTRSFRTERLPTLLRHGSEQGVVRAELAEAGRSREQVMVLSPTVRRATIDGKRPARLVEYAQRTPVVAFHPGDLELVAGAASFRRRLLDRVALFIDAAGYEHKSRYERALKERQRALEERGERAAEHEAFEQVAAQEGARYQLARERAAKTLVELVPARFERLAPSALSLDASYVPGGSTDVSVFRRELEQRRTKDRFRRSSSFGPGRDEFELRLDGSPARSHASQGQQRILTLALKLAELDAISEARGAPAVLLLDDVSSELDPARTGAVYEVLRTSAGQVFVTTTRPELFPTPDRASERIDFGVERGTLRVSPAA